MRFPIKIKRFVSFATWRPDSCLRIPVTHIIDGNAVANMLSVPVSMKRIKKFDEADEVGVIFIFKKPVFAYVTRRKK